VTLEPTVGAGPLFLSALGDVDANDMHSPGPVFDTSFQPIVKENELPGKTTPGTVHQPPQDNKGRKHAQHGDWETSRCLYELADAEDDFEENQRKILTTVQGLMDLVKSPDRPSFTSGKRTSGGRNASKDGRRASQSPCSSSCQSDNDNDEDMEPISESLLSSGSKREPIYDSQFSGATFGTRDSEINSPDGNVLSVSGTAGRQTSSTNPFDYHESDPAADSLGHQSHVASRTNCTPEASSTLLLRPDDIGEAGDRIGRHNASWLEKKDLNRRSPTEDFFEKSSGQILPLGPLREASPQGYATRWYSSRFEGGSRGMSRVDIS